MLDKKTTEEIEILREGGRILGQILQQLASEVKPGMTGWQLDELAEKLILQAGGEPAFLHFHGFPNSLCVSINETVVHGIPTKKPFEEGDIVGLDLGLKYKGLFTDAALTVPVGKIDAETEKFINITKESLEIAISQVSPDGYIGDIGRAIEKFVKPHGYGIVKDLSGHGVGRQVHEDPYIPNFDVGRKLQKMFPGLVLAIEPMLVMGGNDEIKISHNGWDAQAKDGSLTAHFEHTIAVTEDGYLILTDPAQ